MLVPTLVKSRVSLLLVALTSGLLVVVSTTSAASTRHAVATAPSERVLVKFTRGATQAQIARVTANASADDRSTIHGIGVHVLRVPSSRLETALSTFRHSPLVAFAEREGLLKAQEILPADPYFLNSGSWNISGGAWGWYQTRTTQAWDITQGNGAIKIAILDTGIKTAGLNDFDGQIASTWNAMNGTTDVTSNAGNHGTYVAGVTGLTIGNGVGSAGFCPLCKLMIVQVGTDSGATWSDLASGLTWAADHGARVANMSWAGTTDSATMQAATTYAHQHGVVMTAAAGNSNCNCASYPSADPYVLGVAGTDPDGNKQYDSNYGKWFALAAPEGNLTGFPTANGQPGYAAFGGTSSAAPVVAGIAGLLFSYNGSLTNTQVEQALGSSAAPVPFAVQYGRVDALGALQFLGASDPQPASPPVQVGSAQIYYAVHGLTSIAPLTTAPQIGQMLVRGIGGWSGSTGLDVTNLQWQRCDSNGNACSFLGDNSYYTVQSADTGATIKLAFTVRNGLGAVPVAVLSSIVGGAVATQPPGNTSLPSVSGTAQAGQTVTGSNGSWSGSPTGFGYQWQRCDGSGSACAPIVGANGGTYAIQTADVGSTLRLAVTATNSAGTATATSAPTSLVSTVPTPAPAPTPATQTVTFSGSLSQRNPARSFSVKVGSGVVDARLSFSKCSTLALGLAGGPNATGPSVVVLDSLLSAGTYTYNVSGGRCSFSLTVTAPSP